MAAIGILTILTVLNMLVGDPRTRLSMGEEGSFGAWYSSMQFFSAAVACGLVALIEKRLRTAWTLLVLVLVAFSVIDVTQVHHPVENAADLTLAVLGWQPLAVAVIAAILFAAGRQAGATARRCLLGAIPCLVLAQLSSIGYNQFDPPAGVVDFLGVVEEIFEMMVGALALTAAASELASRVQLRSTRRQS